MRNKRIKQWTGWAIGLALYVAIACMAPAAITVDGYFRLGENDPGAAAGQPGKNPTLDTTATKGLTIGAGVPTNIAVAGSTAIQRTGSTLAMSFGGTSYYVTNNVLTALNDNMGIEAWFRPDSISGSQIIAANGGAGNAFGLWLNSGSIYGYKENGMPIFSVIGAAVGYWCHAAYVVTNGIGCIYVNGALCNTNTFIGPAPASCFTIGAYNLGGAAYFNGAVDEVRMFHFDAGAFRASDLLCYEPLARPYYTRAILADNPLACLRMNESVGPGIFNMVSSSQQTLMANFYRKGTFGSESRTVQPLVTTNGLRPDSFRGFEAGNTAPYFDGTGSGNTAQINLPPMGTNYSVEFWLYNTRVDPGLISGYMLSRGTNEFFGIGGAVLSGKLFAYNTSAEVVEGTSYMAGVGPWCHVALVRSGTTVSLYLNGMLQNSGTMSVLTTSSTFVLGHRTLEGGFPFQGYIDELSIYDYALTAGQILAHYNCAVYGAPSGTIVIVR